MNATIALPTLRLCLPVRSVSSNDGRMILTFGTRTTFWKYISPPLVIGSESLNAVRNGLSQVLNTSQAFRLAGIAGSSGEVGTNAGKILAPAL